jgi:hypothetical protein
MFPSRIDSVSSVLRRPLASVTAAALLAASPPVLADAVTDWNEFADTLALGAPPMRSRITAIMHIAMHDALNSVEARYESYTLIPPAQAGASPEAAIGEAAYQALKGAAPASLTGAITDFYNNWYDDLAGCPSAACTNGIAAGAAAANAILLQRNGDGSANPHVPAYSLSPAPGVYQPTPVTTAAGTEAPPVAPQFTGWGKVSPFVLRSGSQFRAEPSPQFNLRSQIYRRDFDEVQRLGAVDSQERTTDQSEIARYWPGGGSNMNAVARTILVDYDLDLWQHARLFALLNIALADSAITVFDTKYAYNFWRPVTAIRAAGDTTWLSYQNTPPYPDYTCGLPNNVGAGLQVLRSYFGTDRIAYRLTTPGGIERSYESLSDAGAEAVDARVFGGMHFRTGCARGLLQGGDVGRYVFKNALRPLGKNGLGHG